LVFLLTHTSLFFFYTPSLHDALPISLLMLTSRVFLPMLVVILVADMVSGETTSGSIKLLLIRPVSRLKILLGKWLVSMGAVVIIDRKSTRLNSSHVSISYAVFCLKNK